MFNHIVRATILATLAPALVFAQGASVAPEAVDVIEPPATIEPPVAGGAQPSYPVPGATAGEAPAPIAPPVNDGAAQPLGIEPASAGVAPAADVAATQAGSMVSDFQGDDVGTVLRLLGRQAGINVVVSDKVQGQVTMRLVNMTPLDALKVVVTSKNLFLDEVNGVYYVKTAEEKQAEPTFPQSYTFSYASADKIAPLLQSQLNSKAPPQVDVRTNTIFYREVQSNLDNVKEFLAKVDKVTEQVMIEARLVEVTANPQQAYGINWSGVVGGATADQPGRTFRWGASPIPDNGTFEFEVTNGNVTVTDFVLGGLGNPKSNPLGANFLEMAAGQFAILTSQQYAITLRLMNEDKDTEFLANPRLVTSNNQPAKIKITRNQPVPQLNFNEQTATAVFGGFEDKEFGNQLTVVPSINKDGFINLTVKPEISNKVGDATFAFAGAVVSSPIIDKRELDSNVLIRSGDTLAVGGLLQDDVNKGRTKVPILGDLPVVGYAFQQRINSRTKRNLLIFVTPTIIKQGYGTGLENQVSGLSHSGEEFADPNSWRNNARGAIRVVPTSNRQVAADYPKPGTPLQPTKYKTGVPQRER